MKSILGILIMLSIQVLAAQSNGAPTVSTGLGEIQGKLVELGDKKYEEYLGIPYAKPPVGMLRFQKPQPIESYDEKIVATSMSPSCPQIDMKIFSDRKIFAGAKSEDCLYLNIWKPVSDNLSPKPVMFWIYGGGFTVGWAGLPYYLGDILSTSGDVIVVSFNYRVGALGFLKGLTEDEPGNIGLYDQNQALKWVKEHIHQFGGDPQNITIFGESAGSCSVAFHMISPVSQGLFKRAILQSGTSNLPLFNHNAQITLMLTTMFARILNCLPEGEALSEATFVCLREKSFEEINDAENALIAANSISFLPTIGEDFLPLENVKSQQAAFTKDVDIIAGVNGNEGAFMLEFIFPTFEFSNPAKMMNKLQTQAFVNMFIGKVGNEQNPSKYTSVYFENVTDSDVLGARQALVDILSDFISVCPSIFFADRHSSLNKNAHFYRFTHRSSLSVFPQWMKDTHFEEIPFVFGTPLRSLPYQLEEKHFSSKIMELWTSFAKGEDLVEKQWANYIPQEGLAKELNPSKSSMISLPRAERCYQIWKPWFDNMYNHIGYSICRACHKPKFFST